MWTLWGVFNYNKCIKLIEITEWAFWKWAVISAVGLVGMHRHTCGFCFDDGVLCLPQTGRDRTHNRCTHQFKSGRDERAKVGYYSFASTAKRQYKNKKKRRKKRKDLADPLNQTWTTAPFTKGTHFPRDGVYNQNVTAPNHLWKSLSRCCV